MAGSNRWDDGVLDCAYALADFRVVHGIFYLRNYDADFSAVVTACSSVIAPIIPPGIGLILYGFLADQSVGRLFIGGIVPGIMMCFALMYVVNKISVKRNYVSISVCC